MFTIVCLFTVYLVYNNMFIYSLSCLLLAVVDLLIKRGAPVDLRDSAQSTPLFQAVTYGHPDVVKLLVKGEAYMKEYAISYGCLKETCRTT